MQKKQYYEYYANVCLKANVKFGDMNSFIDKTLLYFPLKKSYKIF